ncbi:MAG: hypothetical protein NT108_02515 [Candidatus Kaiserbacteria bacterium]|nr:hypothetical protein [Candidatus Kaiserbacteria bacterium]
MTSFLNRVRGSAAQDPARDWFAVLTLASILLAGIIVWNIWAFDTVANGGVIGPAVTIAPPIFSSASLELVHQVFETHAMEESKFKTGSYRYVDPSQ